MDELFLYLGIYIIVLFVMSWWIGRKETEEGFLIAERNRPWWQVACSKYAITIGAAWYVAYTAFAYEYGLNVLTLLIGLVFGYVFFAWWGAPRIKRYSEEGGGFYTMHEFVKKRTGSTHAEFLANGVVLLYVTMFLFVGVVAGGTLLESYGYVTYEQAVVLTLLVVTGYVLLAGFKAVILTDVLQGTIMLGLLLAIVYSFVGQSTYSFAEIAESRPIDALTVAMFGIFGLIATFAAPDRYQLSYAGKSKITLQWVFAAAAVPVFLSAIALVGIGTVMYLVNPGLEGAEVFPTAMTQVLSPEFASLAIVMF
ncbi:hypothetical protein KC953_02910, partial [Candidatus Saccharibacteria bacterium]|nr:hypothetical protein [Candidatus Saccharibacteria bacterium]